jgi:hypothetical protein
MDKQVVASIISLKHFLQLFIGFVDGTTKLFIVIWSSTTHAS